jgi:hypothetical protein
MDLDEKYPSLAEGEMNARLPPYYSLKRNKEQLDVQRHEVETDEALATCVPSLPPYS